MTKEEKVKAFMKRIPDHIYRMDYKELAIECHDHFPRLPMPIIEFDNAQYFFNQRESGGMNLIYRARKNDGGGLKPWNNVADISIHRKEDLHKIKTFGRLNKPGESVFYGSLNYSVACSEATSKGNVFSELSTVGVTVGVWKFETPMTFVQIPRSLKWFEYLYKNVSFKPEKLLPEEIIKKNSNLKEMVADEHSYDILSFFADEFAKIKIDSHLDYQLSNYYADRIFRRFSGFDDSGNVDGIMYPSISLSYEHFNLALKPEVVGKLKFLQAMNVWINSPPGSGLRYEPMMQGYADAQGNLKWGR